MLVNFRISSCILGCNQRPLDSIDKISFDIVEKININFYYNPYIKNRLGQGTSTLGGGQGSHDSYRPIFPRGVGQGGQFFMTQSGKNRFFP